MEQRPISDDEREVLERMLGVGDAGEENRRQIFWTIVYMWGFSAAALTVIWQLVAWLIRLSFEVDFGWDYEGSGFIFFAIVVSTGAASAYIWLRAVRGRTNRGSAAEEDLHTKHVIEESLEIVGVKCFQEQEHGGLIYFLKTNDDRTFVIYDAESQDLGVDGKDPLGSSFRPMSQLTIARTPAAQIVVSTTFGGIELPLPDVEDLLIDPAGWPEEDDFCDIPWDELEARLSG